MKTDQGAPLVPSFGVEEAASLPQRVQPASIRWVTPLAAIDRLILNLDKKVSANDSVFLDDLWLAIVQATVVTRWTEAHSTKTRT